MQLIIGNKNYSSWSLRPWLLLHAHGLDFSEVHESLQKENIQQRLGKYSDSCKVPVLIDEDNIIWDSLSICEYLSENYLVGAGWPESARQRAQARSICAEMHSGFSALRSELPMNCRAVKKMILSAELQNDIQRIDAIWSQYASTDSDGSLRLFGSFGIADCFFAPVAIRFNSYGIVLSEKAAEYQASLLEHLSVVRWIEDALAESEVLPENEI